MNRWMAFFLRNGFFAASLCALLACGPSFSDYCEAKMDCEDGNEADVDACIEALEVDEDLADMMGCGDYFEERWECLESEWKCEKLDPPLEGHRYQYDDNDCEEERRLYNNCT